MITKSFVIHGEHRGIKYTLEEKPICDLTRSKFHFYTWYELTKEYVFESSVINELDATRKIDSLKSFGFL